MPVTPGHGADPAARLTLPEESPAVLHARNELARGTIDGGGAVGVLEIRSKSKTGGKNADRRKTFGRNHAI